MATTSSPQDIGGNDPSVQRQIERQTSTLLSIGGVSSPPAVATTGTTGTSTGAIRSVAPIVSGSETVFPQSTAATSGNSVTITSSVNNEAGDITTVYTSSSRINVNPVNQTINQYLAVDSGVNQIISGNNIAITSTGGNGTGTVTISADLANITYSNSNVVSLMASFGSNSILTSGTVTAGGFTGNGAGLTSLQGSAVSGQVSYAAVANSVAAANVSGLGNVSTINLDGNVSNVLRGDGTFAPDANSTYGNSEVANYLPTYTGNLSGDYLVLTHDANANVVYANFLYGDGSNISNLPVGNIATVNLDGNASNVLLGNGSFAQLGISSVSGVGNIATLNLDGNASNILYGNGSFANVPPTYTNSDVANLLAAFGSNTIVTTGIITADGANLSNVPYANLTGAPTLGNIAAINLDGNNQTWLAGNGVFANIAIPTVGNIAAINLDGNVSNVLRGDGTFAPDANSSYGDSNVTSLLGAFGSNTIVTTGIITADGANLSNVPYANLTGAPTLGNIVSINLDGNVSNVLRGDGTFGADANSSYGDSNVTSLLGAFGSNTIVTTGIITADGANLSNVPYGNLTGAPTLGNIVSINTDGNASNVLLGNGVFSSVPGLGNVGAANFDGNAGNVLYGNGIFAAAPSGGGLPLANGNTNFNIATIDGNATITVNNTATFTFTEAGNFNLANGNSVVQSVPNNAGDLSGLSTLNLIPDSSTGDDRYLIVDPTGPNHIHIRAGGVQDGSNSLLFLGGEQAYVQIDDTVHEVQIGAYDNANTTSYFWRFENDGNLTLPSNTVAINFANNTPAFGNIVGVNLDGNVSNTLVGDGTFVALPVINANTVVWSTAPVANTSNGAAGQAAYDSGGNLYVCVATDTWAKFTGTTSW